MLFLQIARPHFVAQPVIFMGAAHDAFTLPMDAGSSDCPARSLFGHSVSAIVNIALTRLGGQQLAQEISGKLRRW
jgi:hypothetical protein